MTNFEPNARTNSNPIEPVIFHFDYKVFSQATPHQLYKGTHTLPDSFYETITDSLKSIDLKNNNDVKRDLMEMHQRSGLTWKEISQLCGVTDRMIHFWITGKRKINQEKLDFLTDLKTFILIVDRGRSYKTRELFRGKILNNSSLMSMLKSSDFESLNAWSQSLEPRPSILHPSISSHSLQAKHPSRLTDLVESANTELKHSSISKARSAKVGRIRKK